MELLLRDFFSFDPSAGRSGGPTSDPKIREASRSGKGLKVTFSASHAGMVNGNFVMYSPKGMKDSAHTWVWPQRQAIQVHHDDHADPIGRIIGARYVGYDTSDVNENQQDSLRAFNDVLQRDDIVAAAKVLEDSKVLLQDDWRGVGELILDGIVTDADAIEKILDGRYQGISITQRPKQALCSICGQDWVKDGQCEHPRGEVDEETGRVMYLVVGDTSYAEASCVNRPADPYAQITSVEQLSDSLSARDNYIGATNSPASVVSFQLIDSLDEDLNMTIKKDKPSKVTDKPVEDIKDDLSPAPEDVKDELPEDPKQEDPIVEEDEKKSDNKEDEPQEDIQDTPENTVEEALKCLFEDGDLSQLLCDLLFDAMEELIEEDAKLSTKKRKSLASSTFCGPGRSFPVNDCAHYTAAKRLIGRYKGPGDKSAIMSCINRRGKTLGCPTDTSADEVNDEIKNNEFRIDSLSDDELVKSLLSVEKLMVSRGLRAERKCEHCEEKDAQITQFEGEVPELRDTVKVLRSEYKIITGEHSASEDAHSKTLEEYEISLRDMATTTLLLTDKDTSEEDIKSKIASMTFDELKKVTKETNISEVISFVRSGLSRDPEATVDISDAITTEKTTSDSTVKLTKSLVNFYNSHGTNFAIQCMNDWIRAGKLPEDFTLDKAFEIVAE